jgi:hypothetical protein
MSKVDKYRATLRTLEDWDLFLLTESGLPGKRGNLELAHAVADEGSEELFERYLSFDPVKAPANSPHEFLAFCGVVGLGRLLSEGRMEVLNTLRPYASDPKGDLLEKRTAAAALCEPKLLSEEKHIERVLQVLDEITASIQSVENRKSDEFKALRKALGYCWSVAVVALPEEGERMIERWFSSDDKDVLWIMKENLRKKRLIRMDAEWVARWKVQLGM